MPEVTWGTLKTREGRVTTKVRTEPGLMQPMEEFKWFLSNLLNASLVWSDPHSPDFR